MPSQAIRRPPETPLCSRIPTPLLPDAAPRSPRQAIPATSPPQAVGNAPSQAQVQEAVVPAVVDRVRAVVEAAPVAGDLREARAAGLQGADRPPRATATTPAAI